MLYVKHEWLNTAHRTKGIFFLIYIVISLILVIHIQTNINIFVCIHIQTNIFIIENLMKIRDGSIENQGEDIYDSTNISLEFIHCPRYI
jgi:hypothetical protein